MRLLRTSTPEPVLDNFVSSTPPYAILSHTWGEDEVLFLDLINDARREARRSKGGAGWQKLEASRRFALERGFEYIWNDTCCIDKDSSAELSESINSMFRFYSESSLCVALISDVSHGNIEETVRKEEFERSRWFSRGWTLQELLAPSDIVFVDAGWAVIGLKSDLVLSALIRKATGISTEGLADPLSPKISVAEKMSWAARRETTREEDIAYCLMGLFQVNMPPLYGEGSYNAFLRLQLEIIKLSKDRSLFAWLASNDNLTHRGLLANSPQEFHASGTVRFAEESQIGRVVERAEATNDKLKMMSMLCCITCGLAGVASLLCYACGCTNAFSSEGDNELRNSHDQFLRVDPTFTMTNANLHIYFPYRQLSDAVGAVYLDCFQDGSSDKPLWIYVRSVGNGQFQRIRPNTFYPAPQITYLHWDPAEPHIREMQFQQPSLNGYTSRLWRTSAKKCIFVVPLSLTSINQYRFMQNDQWHPKHPTEDFLTNPSPLQASETSSSSWCLPFYDATNQKGFIFSVRVDCHTRRMHCDVLSVESAPTESEMFLTAKSYWQECIFPSKRYLLSRSHGDRAFFTLNGGLIIRMRVRNVTASPEWESKTVQGTAVFAIDVTLIRDRTLAQMFKPLSPPVDHSDITLVFLVQLDQNCRFSLDDMKTSHLELGDTNTLVSVRLEDLPMPLTMYGSFGQVDVHFGLDDDGKSWVDLGLSSSDEVNESFTWSETKGNRLSLVSGQWLRRTNAGETLESEIIIGTGKIMNPFQFGSYWVSVNVVENTVAALGLD